MNCQRCGSVLDPTARTCPFCGLTTPHGAVASQMDEAAAQMNAQRRAFVDDQQRRIAIARNESSATTAMWVSLISVVLCCSPMGIVGAALGFKARSEANKLGAPPSSKTMIAIAIGLVGAIATACLLTFAWVSSTQEEEAADKRAAEIDKKIAPKLTAPTIDHDTACQLAESYLIHNGWDDRSGYLYSHVECFGKLVPGSDTAELEDMTFKYTSDTLKVSACLKRGVKWYVDRLATGSCAAPVGEATDLDASAAPSATPSTSSVPSSSATTKPSPRRH